MAIEGEYRIGAPRQAVWAALNDVEVLKACIPGCEALTRQSETEIDGRIQAQLGPIRASFGTRLTLSDMVAPVGYTITGEGKAAVGFGKGAAKVELVDDAGGTLLKYSATMQLGGKLAQLGSRLVEAATRQLADQFFDAFAKHVDAGATRTEPTVTADAAPVTPAVSAGLPRWFWAAAAFAAAAILVWVLTQRASG